jgi:hypothetical protein
MHSNTERRSAERRVPEGIEPLARLRLRTGSELSVVNLSNIGALVEGSARLLPGRHLDVHVVTSAGRVLVRCRVVRSFVCRIGFDVMYYRSALAFERNIDTASAGQQVPVIDAACGKLASSDYPGSRSSGFAERRAGVPL